MMARFVKQGKNQRVGADEGMVRQSPIHANDTAAGPNDRLGVDGVEAFDELAGASCRVVAGDVEKCFCDR